MFIFPAFACIEHTLESEAELCFLRISAFKYSIYFSGQDYKDELSLSFLAKGLCSDSVTQFTLPLHSSVQTPPPFTATFLSPLATILNARQHILTFAKKEKVAD